MQFYLILSLLEIFSGCSPEDILTHPTTASITDVLVLTSMSQGGRSLVAKIVIEFFFSQKIVTEGIKGLGGFESNG